MAETKKARLVHQGKMLTVVLPEDFGLEGDEVYVTRDAETGDVTLSRQPKGNVWQDFIAFRDAHPVSDEEWEIFDTAIREARENAVPMDDRRVLDILREDE
ncbi:MAG: hypothetical protein M3457_00745 [Chloroflexota bacterium]|nr:hypothetical protein [Chloroflexota bacterium]